MSNTRMVAVYARVSSDQQAKSGTIDSQIAALKERVATDGEQIAEEMFFVDAGVSGATLVRPQLERLRDQAAFGLMDRLYILSPDRLSRKYAHQVLLMEELSACGVEVVFLNHAVGTTPEEELLLQMQGMISEYERAKIMERNRRGKLHGAKRGSVNVLSTTLWLSLHPQAGQDTGPVCHRPAASGVGKKDFPLDRCQSPEHRRSRTTP